MRVAYCIRNDYLSKRGGDTVQLLKTKAALERHHGVSGEVVTDPSAIDGKRYDLCHVFNLLTEKATAAFFERCRKERVRTALSPIFWDLRYAVANHFLTLYLGVYDISERKIALARTFFDTVSGLIGAPRFYTKDFRKNYLGRVLADVDLLLPNSTEELRFLSYYSGIEPSALERKARIVVNGIDPELFGEGPAPAGGGDERDTVLSGLPRDYVLQVGTITPLKNQYSLVRALFERKDIPIVFIGRGNDCPRYYGRTRALAEKRGGVYFIEAVDHADLKYYYRKAMLHIQPSLQETTGLASLEALASGCKAVVSNGRHCPYESYFKDRATGIDPLDVGSIREGIEREHARARDMADIGKSLQRTHAWQEAARQTNDAYASVLNRRAD